MNMTNNQMEVHTTVLVLVHMTPLMNRISDEPLNQPFNK